MRLLLWLGVVVMFNLLNVLLFFQGYLYQRIAVLYIAPTLFAAAAALLCSQVLGKAGLRDPGWLLIYRQSRIGDTPNNRTRN